MQTEFASQMFTYLHLDYNKINLESILPSLNQQWAKQFVKTNLIFGIWDYPRPLQQNYQNWSHQQELFHKELLLKSDKKKKLLKLMEQKNELKQQTLTVINKHYFMNEQINPNKVQNLKYLIIENMELQTQDIADILRRLNIRGKQLEYLGLQGNRIKNIDQNEQFMSFLPDRIETLNLRNNKLNNQDIRQLLCHGKKVNIVLDIRQNSSLTKSCSKNFPIFYHQSCKKITIVHDLVWQKDARCCKKFISFLDRTSIKFKYYPLVKTQIQQNKRLYCHSMILMWASFLIFYIYCFTVPYFFQTNHGQKTTCQNGFEQQIHIAFGVFLTFLGIYQLCFIIKIRKLVKRKIKIFGLRNILVFSKLTSGVLSRLDLYTDVLFVLIFKSCYDNDGFQEQGNKQILNFTFFFAAITLGVSLLFPIAIFLYVVIDPCRKKKHFYLPHIERMARLSNVSQFKGLSAVLGSYCPDLKIPFFNCCDKSVPRYHAVSKLFLEDIIQTICQIIFLQYAQNKKGAEAVLSIGLTIGSLLLSVAQICLARGAKPSEKIRKKYPPVNLKQKTQCEIPDQRRRIFQRRASIIRNVV